MRRLSAALMILPLLAGLGTTIGVSDLLYPTGNDERLATARVGAWLAGVALVVFISLEAFPADRRGLSALILTATAAGVAAVVGHDIRAGVGLSPVVVFFIPAVFLAMANLFSFSAVEGNNRTLLVAARRKLALVGCLTGFAAAYLYFTAGMRGLVVDFVMLAAALACGLALFVCGVVVSRGQTKSAALVTLVAAAVGLVALRDYFIWQAALLGGSAYLSHLAHTASVASTNADVTPVAPSTNSPTL